MQEQKRIAKEVQEKLKQEKESYAKLSDTQTFSKQDTLSNEKTTDNVYRKVKAEQKEYKRIVADTQRKSKQEEKYTQDLVQKAEDGIYQYSKDRKNSHTSQQSNIQLDHYLDAYSDILQSNKAEYGIHNISNGLYIVVSLSIPGIALEHLHAQATRVGGKLIIRGLKNNSFTETITAIKALGEQGIAVDINPGIFTRYNIQRVPHIILISDKGTDTISGNISLTYALSEFKASGDTKEEAERCMRKLWH